MAQRLFVKAERLQAERQREHPRLCSVRGYRYCELLLAEPEQAAWQHWLASLDPLCSHPARPRPSDEGRRPTTRGEDRTRSAYGRGTSDRHPDRIAELQDTCNRIVERTTQMLTPPRPSDALLGMALDHLIRGRACMFSEFLDTNDPTGPSLDGVAEELADAVDGLRAAASQEHIPAGLLSRAWLRHALGDPDAARADLDEAHRIAARGGMALHLADIALYRARLFHDRTALAEARRLIETYGYGRRLPELQDAEAAAAGWAE